MFHESGLVTPDPDGTSGLSRESLWLSRLKYFGGTETGDFMQVVHTV